MDLSSGWASRVNSNKVVPERGNATMKIGLSSMDGRTAVIPGRDIGRVAAVLGDRHGRHATQGHRRGGQREIGGL